LSNYLPIAGGVLTGDMGISKNAPTIVLKDVGQRTGFIHVNDNNFYILRGGVSADTWDSGPNSRQPLTVNLENGNVTASGDVTAYSDERLKKNVSVIENALKKTLQLEGVNFEKKDTNVKSIGLIAQKVKEVLPEVVTEDDNGYLAVSYGNIVGLLVEAIKELTKKVEFLENKINS
jgi:hypothetical protein